ncbi:acyltransferase family protein [Botrimarina hoheduenensis]|uniref:Uncharacterized protein n=1 Tax=Botrimarina hoheduenensis TaxID=2528000 RepID=A0A5C5W8X9_9BACT|nr:DUF5009 domain-containing protein [Botrimarina hoheduenensis]TWT46723.1 hypothetical protein Pla111_18240 [Botrimarina hoheduenensis]
MPPDAVTKPDRLLSLDVMRGLTILAMILVNNPGSWGAMYWPLGHAAWHGWTPTDLIFPFFLFMVGVAMAYSFAKYTTGEGTPTGAVWWRIVRRVLLLILLGLMLAGSGRILQFFMGTLESWDLATLRWPGVLQRIGLAYLGASLVVLLLGKRGQMVVALGLLLVYAGLLRSFPADVPPTERLAAASNVVRAVDRAVIGPQHMWTQATTNPTDPEGLLSTLPAIVTTLLGYAVGCAIKGKPASRTMVTQLLLAGVGLAALGQAWHAVPSPWGMPINKALWTPSFVLLSGGLAIVTLALCLFTFDVVGKGSNRLAAVATAFQMVGVNAIFVFVASGFFARLLTLMKFGEVTLKDGIYAHLVTGPLNAIGLADPKLASLAYALGFVAVWWLVLWAMWRRGWSVRV